MPDEALGSFMVVQEGNKFLINLSDSPGHADFSSEMALNQAISMVSYFASSSEPAQIRGKTVYIQYSNRQEIVNNKSSGDIAGNVLLVTTEGIEAGDVTIDIIHLVDVYTDKPTAWGFQALIQYSDAETASEARNSLDGRRIPRYLLPEHVNSCHLRISFSAHTDLNIKFQSHRSRDYTNPYLPVNPSAIEGTVQPIVGPDGNQKEPESNVLLASIGNMQYAVTVDVLHTVFSAFGTVQKIAIFEKNGGMQDLVQYPDVPSIYNGGYCKLHLSYSRHTDINVKANNDRSRDYTLPDTGVIGTPQAPGWQSNPQAAYAGNGYTSGVQPAVPGPIPAWDPSVQGGRQTVYASAPATYTGASQYPTLAASQYPTSTAMQSSQQMPLYGQPPHY